MEEILQRPVVFRGSLFIIPAIYSPGTLAGLLALAVMAIWKKRPVFFLPRSYMCAQYPRNDSEHRCVVARSPAFSVFYVHILDFLVLFLYSLLFPFSLPLVRSCLLSLLREMAFPFVFLINTISIKPCVRSAFCCWGSQYTFLFCFSRHASTSSFVETVLQ